MVEIKNDTWNSGDPYEYFMGRWSRLMAPEFLRWLNASQELSWLDIGCGTGALSEAIFQRYKPAKLSCVDPSAEFLAKAKNKQTFTADFFVAGADALPFSADTFDVVVSGLAFNFFPDPSAALTEIKRVLKKGGTVAAYVWDYAGKMEFLRYFWDVAAEVDKDAAALDEGIRFPVCNPTVLQEIFSTVGMVDIKTTHLDIETVFNNFDDYWQPFLGGQGPAPGYLASINEEKRQLIKIKLQERLISRPDGSIPLLARAIAIQGNYQS